MAKPIKITKELLLEEINRIPEDIFSFVELENRLPGSYETLKDAIFEILNDTQSGVKQFFDNELKQLRFKREKA